MAFFADLTPHTYAPTAGRTVLNIGWLDRSQPFPTGTTSQEFQDALRELCARPIILHRGVHSCQFCRGTGNPVHGNGQIRVLGKNGAWYAAPTMVHHYVTAHGYLPPDEFIEAVLTPVAVSTDEDVWYSDG